VERIFQRHFVPDYRRIFQSVAQRALWSYREMQFMTASRQGAREVGNVNFAAAHLGGRTKLEDFHRAGDILLSKRKQSKRELGLFVFQLDAKGIVVALLRDKFNGKAPVVHQALDPAFSRNEDQAGIKLQGRDQLIFAQGIQDIAFAHATDNAPFGIVDRRKFLEDVIANLFFGSKRLGSL